MIYEYSSGNDKTIYYDSSINIFFILDEDGMEVTAWEQ